MGYQVYEDPNHRWRWGYTAVGLSVIVLLLVLIAGDVAELLS